MRGFRARERENSVKVVKRTGEIVDFDRARIRDAIYKAVVATSPASTTEDEMAKLADDVTTRIVDEVQGRFVDFFPNVENIQDIVEKQLVLADQYETAKAYILYRAERQKVRDAAKKRAIEDARVGKLTATKSDGRVVLFNVKKVEETLSAAAEGLDVDVDLVLREVVHNVYDGVPTQQIAQAMVLAAAAYIERDPSYSKLAARLQAQIIYSEVIGDRESELGEAYRGTFAEGIREGLRVGRLDQRMDRFDLALLSASIKPERDEQFEYLGIQTLYDRYLIRDHEGACLEVPQGFWMRVAMGLSIEEPDPNARALEFYDVMSKLEYVPSTPTLFHSGTSHPQLSSCYLTTIDDHLAHIFKSLGDNAQLSKWSGGIGNDWSYIRATGAHIQSTNVDSQGVVPFLKIANDVTMAINRSGKRRGATCAYLETWHYDIEDFLDLRKNTGDDRRRTHDMNTANWIPDLFMKRVMNDEHWSLFSPNEVPDLHDLFGSKFEARFVEYEQKGEAGELRLYKRIRALDLWRKMLTMLFETGHPWMTFKDACNVRSPQDHVGVIHSSNLCTEITLNTSAEETAVCNLGSVNLSRHIDDGKIDEEHIGRTVRTAIRMLDNVIDINFYPTDEARNSNLKHRPIGLGCMGLQDALYQLDVAFDTDEAVEVADRLQELISYNAILTSSELAKERGAYPSYQGSKWDRGLLPIDTIDLLEQERGVPIEVSRTQRLDWGPVRQHLAEHGMRNSNTMAIAPTATISNISGCFPCIEPIYKNIYVKANISGEFTIANRYLVEDLKELGLWDAEMLEQLKYYDGSVQRIEAIPAALRDKYKEAFEIDALRCLQHTAARGKWIDQSQSHNVFLKGTSGKRLAEVYMAAWKMGLKTTYYLRSLAATQVEKSTLDASKYGYTQKREYEAVGATTETASAATTVAEAATAEAPTTEAPTVQAPVAQTPRAQDTVAQTPVAEIVAAEARAAESAVAPAAPAGPPSGTTSTSDALAAAMGATPAASPGPAAPAAESRQELGSSKQPEANLCRIDDPDCEACQ
ncbi:MAG: ribonucleoside-diphosphate reductase subunit alpha [Acidobacteriota bacterium]